MARAASLTDHQPGRWQYATQISQVQGSEGGYLFAKVCEYLVLLLVIAALQNDEFTNLCLSYCF